MIDLHVHSTFSDGSLTPSQLVAEAAADGVSVLALTDHDTTDGIEPFLAASEASGGRVAGIAGVEISVEIPGKSVHVLGYFMDVHEPGLQSLLQRIRQARHQRNLQMLETFRELGVDMSESELLEAAGGEVVGRPHFAAVLVQRGIVRTSMEAFDRYLGRGRAAYAERYRPSPEEGIGAIRVAGGVAVLAHPGGLRIGKRGLRILLTPLVALGLEGIEVYYSEHSSQQQRRFASLAEEFGLVMTGGSDFHGSANPKVRMGRGQGKLNVPPGVPAALAARAGVVWTAHP